MKLVERNSALKVQDALGEWQGVFVPRYHIRGCWLLICIQQKRARYWRKALVYRCEQTGRLRLDVVCTEERG